VIKLRFSQKRYTLFKTIQETAMKNNSMRFILIGLIALCAIQLTACNTVEGVGKDIKKAGESIEKAGDNGKKGS
jgi:entericidin B